MNVITSPKEDPAPQPKTNEPSMEEILASIRRLISDDQAFSLRSDGEGERGYLSAAANSSVRTACHTLLASRFVQHSDVIIGLVREMLRPMLKTWLDDNLPAIVERLVSSEIERVARGE